VQVYSLDWLQTDLDEVSPTVDELVGQLVESRVVFYHSVQVRIDSTTEHITALNLRRTSA